MAKRAYKAPSFQSLKANFPKTKRYEKMWESQEEMLRLLSQTGPCIIEAPTGRGKSAVEYTFLKAVSRYTNDSSLFLITPNKTLVQQIHNEFPDTKAMFGRNEHPCLYYEDRQTLTPEIAASLYHNPDAIKADDIPCSFLHDCPHRVDQSTGKTHTEGALPCPYLQQKYEAMKNGNIVVSTMSFYLFNHLFGSESSLPEALVIDEVHRLADVIRFSLSYDITDYHLECLVELLQNAGISESRVLERFLGQMKNVIRRRFRKKSIRNVLLEPSEIQELLEILEEADVPLLHKKIHEAIGKGKINLRSDRELLRKLELVTRDLRNYMRSLGYALGNADKKPLNYICAYYQKTLNKYQKVEYKLVIKHYSVSALIKKIIPPLTVSFSATIGDPKVFGSESGIQHPFFSLKSNFPSKNCRLYMPTDTHNLAVGERRGERTLIKSLEDIAKACVRFKKRGSRSLVVTVSNEERYKFISLAQKEGLEVVSYDGKIRPRAAANAFREGKGDVLVGTAANYSEGMDLPERIAPVIFFLRPGYPVPNSPQAIFEERRFSNGLKWALWNWRVITQLLQVRGRNIRSTRDVGVTFFISQQFRRLLYGSLPEWLKPSYKGNLSFEKCITDAEKLLRN